MTRRTIKEDTNSITDAPPTASLPKKKNETKERKREREKIQERMESTRWQQRVVPKARRPL